MENVILIVHLILAVGLIGIVLLQRSEGGGLGLGGGGGGGLVSSRSAATALGKLTWVLAIAFICTSITLTIIAAQNAAGTSVLDRIGADAPVPATETPDSPSGESLLPPIAKRLDFTNSDGPLRGQQLKAVLDALNYRNLDDVPEFEGQNTTTEFLAREIYDRIVAAIHEGRLGPGAPGCESLEVVLRESHVAWAGYTGPV